MNLDGSVGSIILSIMQVKQSKTAGRTNRPTWPFLIVFRSHRRHLSCMSYKLPILRCATCTGNNQS